jgi:uncharacterized protein (TIGR02246 family)
MVEIALEIEAIKRLKARYFRLLDTKQWAAWADLFTADATLRWGDAPGDVARGRDAIVAGVSGALAGAVTVHHGHMPEIELRGERSASGVWAMFDYVEMSDRTFKGYGHYEEEYEKGGDGAWRISSLRLTRLRVDRIDRTQAIGAVDRTSKSEE